MAKWTHATSYDVVFGHSSGTEKYTVDPNRILKEAATAAWDNGEPGILYWDRSVDYNLMQHISAYEPVSCNPCSEQMLIPGGTCNLGAINLAEYVVHGRFDYESFKDDVAIYVTAMDEIIDENINNHALPEQRIAALQWRNCGLGTMGMAEAMIKLGITYGSEESIQFVGKVFRDMYIQALITSCELAKEKGTYDGWCDDHADLILQSDFYKNLQVSDMVDEMIKEYGLRNAVLTTIAPTGSISTMLGVSGGIQLNH
jgi:ribonucleoside-diphosphate reductase alpha chain